MPTPPRPFRRPRSEAPLPDQIPVSILAEAAVHRPERSRLSCPRAWQRSGRFPTGTSRGSAQKPTPRAPGFPPIELFVLFWLTTRRAGCKGRRLKDSGAKFARRHCRPKITCLKRSRSATSIRFQECATQRPVREIAFNN